MFNSSNYRSVLRSDWQKFSSQANQGNLDKNIRSLFGFNEPISLSEIREIYIPLTNFLQNYIKHKKLLERDISSYLNLPEFNRPFIIGVAGSVAVGKSTTARILKYLLETLDTCYYDVALVATDGFLYENAVLEEKNILNRKGFPESYDINKLLNFLQDARQGKSNLKFPAYSHHCYDIIPNKYMTINAPEIIILEGLNVLQLPRIKDSKSSLKYCVADFIDFGIYLDAEHDVIENWYLDRFFSYQQQAKNDPSAYMYSLRGLDEMAAKAYGRDIWKRINLLNLKENILPSRSRADIILSKEPTHNISRVYLKV
ncbi:MAG: type I pantothenate kinase [Pseudomonadota bacterium]|nr:type I pantothenate kinase [Pseudomonadota bacterium]